MGVRDVPFQESRLGSCWKLFMQRSARKEAEWELDSAPRHLAHAGPHCLASCDHRVLDRAGPGTETSWILHRLWVPVKEQPVRFL